jgi:hypothetical protein
VEPAQLRALLRALGVVAFFASIGFVWLFSTGEAGSWRDQTTWPPFVRTVGVTLAVVGISLPNLWLMMVDSPGPEASTRRFAILATIFCIVVTVVMALLVIAEPARVMNWLWLAASIAVTGALIRRIWSQVDRTP